MKTVAPEVKAASTYVNNLVTEESLNDIIHVEHRSGNPKRDFLFVNRIQGKHIPCDPKDTIEMCEKLADKVKTGLLDNDRLLVIGFAETATAIGELVAMNIPQATYVMHTTRETVGKDLLEFKEEHSHATEQKLSIPLDTDPKTFISQFNYILFVEDEISTGNTIVNSVKAFRELGIESDDLTFGVASICNWQDEASVTLFNTLGIDRYYLISGELKDVRKKMSIQPKKDLIEIRVNGLNYFGYENERLGRKMDKAQALSDIDKVVEQLGNKYFNELMYNELSYTPTIRVIGTEESMIVPILVANKLEEMYKVHTICHSSTRSKIDIINSDFDNEHTGIKRRYNMPSMYDKDRKTYIYNLDQFTDAVILISDGEYIYKNIEYLPDFNTNQLIRVDIN
jgi:orotate phosphoribosyltransferase